MINDCPYSFSHRNTIINKVKFNSHLGPMQQFARGSAIGAKSFPSACAKRSLYSS